MPRKPVIRDLPSLQELHPSFRAFSATETKTHAVVERLRQTIESVQQDNPRPFYSMREISQFFDVLGQFLGHLRELCVLFEQLEHLIGLLRRKFLPFGGGLRQRFPMLRVGVRVRLVSIRLPRLRQQNQRGCISGLKAERQV